MGILDEVKSLVKTVQQIDNIELYKKILDLQAHIMELLEENRRLKGDVDSLREKLRVKESLKFERDAYWIEPLDGQKDGPFCCKCWDTNQLLVRMIFCGDPAYSECPSCKIAIQILR